MSGAVRSWRVAAMLLRRTPKNHVFIRYCVMCNSRAATRLGHARRRSLSWSGGVCVVTTAVVRPTSRRRRRCSRRRPSSRRISGDGPARESNPGCTRVCVVVVVCGGAVVVGVVGSSSSGGVVCTSSARTSGGSSRDRPRSRPRSRNGDIVRDRAGARASAARARRAAAVPLVVMK